MKFFLEKGYSRTTLAEIVEKAEVSYSSFQNIFRAKDGVLTGLTEFMFSNQFMAARSAAVAELPPVCVYAAETAIQITLTELNENLREIYIEAIPGGRHPNTFSGRRRRSCIRFSARTSRS